MCCAQEPGYVSIYVWPKDHDPDTDLPEGFYDRLRAALAAAGMEYENQ